MSTRSLIGYCQNGIVRYTYCHFDGYPSGVGKTLFNKYQNFDDIVKLCHLKGFSCLEDTYEETKRHEYNDVNYSDEMTEHEYLKTHARGVDYKYLYWTNRDCSYGYWTMIPCWGYSLSEINEHDAWELF